MTSYFGLQVPTGTTKGEVVPTVTNHNINFTNTTGRSLTGAMNSSGELVTEDCTGIELHPSLKISPYAWDDNS